VCSATAWQSAGLQHARETARHVEISAIRHEGTNNPPPPPAASFVMLFCSTLVVDRPPHAHRNPRAQHKAKSRAQKCHLCVGWGAPWPSEKVRHLLDCTSRC
jgi:hypothetical protein